MGHAIVHLATLDDVAPRYGFSDTGEARFAREPLAAEHVGLAYQRLRPNARQAFGHRHERAEEVNVILTGAGRVKIDDEVHEIGPLDAIRVEPQVMRQFEAGPDGLSWLVFGPHHEHDTEIVFGWWAA